MTTLREAAQQALEALKGYRREMACGQPCDAERVLEATLAQQEQPDTDCHAQGVCQRSGYSIGGRKPLTDDDLTAAWMAGAAEERKRAEQAQPVAWAYKGEPFFDGDRWHDQYGVTTDERVAKFRDKDATPLYTTPPVVPQPLTEREVELIDGMIEVQLHHAAQCDLMLARAGGNYTMAERQKGWDMERVELLRKIRSMRAQR